MLEVASSEKELTRQTGSLVQALRQPLVRGQWGEMQLKKVVEIAGMTQHCDFCEQFTLKEDGEKNIRPDMIVYLPGDRAIIIDAKTPLKAYLEGVTLTISVNKKTC